MLPAPAPVPGLRPGDDRAAGPVAAGAGLWGPCFAGRGGLHRRGVRGPSLLWPGVPRPVLGLPVSALAHPGTGLSPVLHHLGTAVRRGCPPDTARRCNSRRQSPALGGVSAVDGAGGGLRADRRAAAAPPGHRAAGDSGGGSSDARGEPVQHVLIDVLPGGLVENFMAQAVVQLHAHVPKSGLPEAVIGLLHALAHVPHRVLVAGDEKHRHLLVHFVHVGLPGDIGQALQHVPEQAQCHVAAAEGVGDIGVHILRAEGHPVVFGPGGGEVPVIRAEGDVVHPDAEGVFPQPAALLIRQQLPAGDNGLGGVAGAAEDAAVHRAGVADEVGPGQKGAHGVAEQKMGLIREDLGGTAAQFLHIVHHMPPAVLRPQVHHRRALDAGLTVAQVVVGCDRKAVFT